VFRGSREVPFSLGWPRAYVNDHIRPSKTSKRLPQPSPSQLWATPPALVHTNDTVPSSAKVFQRVETGWGSVSWGTVELDGVVFLNFVLRRNVGRGACLGTGEIERFGI
jgi:hypothetical protein